MGMSSGDVGFHGACGHGLLSFMLLFIIMSGPDHVPCFTNSLGLYGSTLIYCPPPAFIRKVYAILSLQLFVTFGTVWLFISNESLNSFVRHNSWYAA
jgi:hypothetical protein